ncbi:MAG: threonine ammonia-lyase, biosynthetic [Armatimonadetes bacterium]|nr:threonine ammonia-lyase, biosynthetic [Armatimonadota bacterium]
MTNPATLDHLTPAEYLQRIRSSAVYNVAIKSPLEYAPVISQRTGCEVFLKREDLQPVFSFKLRGAYAAMSRLSPAQLRRGVVAASAGNHAQGVALAARQLSCSATIVVPVTTPEVKTRAIEALGATLVKHGDTYDDAYAHARELESEHNFVFVHPYDDPDVIAGQGTIGLELDEQLPKDCEAVFVAIGGGGLISGIALALKQLRPGIKVIGVEPEDSDAMFLSLQAGERVLLDRVGIFADGVAVKQVGAETFRIAQDWVDEVIVVTNDAICAAVKDVFEDRRAVLEPAGALAIAGLKEYAERNGLQGARLAAVACGANVNFDRLRHISERAALGEHSEAILAVRIPERPGSFRQLCETLGNRSITEFNYRMGDAEEAIIFVGLHTKSASEVETILAELSAKGFEAFDLTTNEIAKTHVRHMVGGKSAHATDERLFHFDFPERPGALLNFLNSLGQSWNISMFHYRNHGADKGRVLCGIQVPAATEDDFQRFLTQLGYDYSEETENLALRLFL